MGIVRFDPFRDLDRIQSEMNRLFEGFGQAPERGLQTAPGARLWSPSVDVVDADGEIVLRAELPGMSQSDINVELHGDTLTLSGERKFENEQRAESFVRVERSYGRFQRTFTLGVPVQQDKVAATYKDGILEVHLPKSEANRPRRVQVTAGDTPTVSSSESGDGTVETTATTTNSL